MSCGTTSASFTLAGILRFVLRLIFSRSIV
jgi:hypothetical protein